MGRRYSVTFDAVAVSAAQDLFYLAPADDKPCCIHGITLANVGGSADAGDAKEAMWRLALIRGHATVGSGGSAYTPNPLMPVDTAAGATARINDTTIASTGSPVNIHTDGWNVRVPYIWLPAPELRPWVSQANGVTMVFRLVAAPPEAVTISGTFYFEEVG